MNRICAAVVVSLFTSAGCASERLYVKVVDDKGAPVTNAIVKVGVPPKTAFWGSSSRHKGASYESITDEKGDAVVSFDCIGAHFRWMVKAGNCYPSNLFEEWFSDFDEIPIAPGVTKVILHEHEKRGEVVLYRKKNPQPMYAYTREKVVRSPILNGRYGFDLQLYDWLPPHGKGKVADFYYIRERPDETNSTKKIRYDKSGFFQFKKGEAGFPNLGDVVGRIEFDEKCGAYIGKKTGCENFPSVYDANSKSEYLNSFPITIVNCDEFGVWLCESPIVGVDKYMVIRSRVKCDEKGNIVSANYSKILGSFGLAYAVGADEVVFNPRPNDTNLEFDPNQNLYTGKKGRGKIP